MIELIQIQLPPAQGFKEACQITILTPSSEKDLIRSIQNKQSLNIVQGGLLNREILEQKQVDVLVAPEFGREKEFLHHRNSGLNHVLCQLAHKNNITIAFDISSLLHKKGRYRSLILGQMRQNVMLCRKYKVRMLLSMFARSEWDQRSSFELEEFGILLGMTLKEAKQAVSSAEFILKDKKEFIRHGLREIN